jgi:hypothetical protein
LDQYYLKYFFQYLVLPRRKNGLIVENDLSHDAEEIGTVRALFKSFYTLRKVEIVRKMLGNQ